MQTNKKVCSTSKDTRIATGVGSTSSSEGVLSHAVVDSSTSCETRTSSFSLQSFELSDNSCRMDTSIELLHTLRYHKPALFDGSHLPAWPEEGSGMALHQLLQLRHQLSTGARSANSVQDVRSQLNALRNQHRHHMASSATAAIGGTCSVNGCMQREGQGLLRQGPMAVAFRCTWEDGSACQQCWADRGELTPRTLQQMSILGIKTPLAALQIQRADHWRWLCEPCALKNAPLDANCAQCGAARPCPACQVCASPNNVLAIRCVTCNAALTFEERERHEACRAGQAVYVTCETSGTSVAPSWSLDDVGMYSPIAAVWGNGAHFWAGILASTWCWLASLR